MKNNFLKRFSVDLDGRIVAAFDTEQEARDWIACRWWLAWASIYDHEKKEIVLTEVRI